MRYLILSDVHSNWEALTAVLADSRGKYDGILSCGDLVGYGPDPNTVLDWARTSIMAGVRGNHDKACAGLEDLEWFNPVARSSAIWTNRILTPENREYLRSLPGGPLPVEDFQILHGSPADEDEYLITREEAGYIASLVTTSVSFFGHTHLQGGFLLHRNGVRMLAPYTFQIENDTRYLVNPGSVGQPRDHDPQAGYVIFTPEQRLVEFGRVSYDIEKTQRKIIQAGLPNLLASRLSVGK